MKTTDFINNTEAGLEYIRDSISDYQLYNGNSYWFNFFIENDDIVSIACVEHSDYTVCIHKDTPNSIERITEIGKKYGYELEEVDNLDADGHKLGKLEYGRIWFETNRKLIFKFMDKVEDEFEHSEEFDKIVSAIYSKVLKIIK